MSARRHRAQPVSVLILRPITNREIQALWSPTYDTEILQFVHRSAAKGVDNAMPYAIVLETDMHNMRRPVVQAVW